ncbi:hypothetical protein DPMN_153004 [Dreissena polymorpha]|nr:hypothetical protein DPMN_153004 [Dreissena polymorpha]
MTPLRQNGSDGKDYDKNLEFLVTGSDNSRAQADRQQYIKHNFRNVLTFYHKEYLLRVVHYLPGDFVVHYLK